MDRADEYVHPVVTTWWNSNRAEVLAQAQRSQVHDSVYFALHDFPTELTTETPARARGMLGIYQLRCPVDTKECKQSLLRSKRWIAEEPESCD